MDLDHIMWYHPFFSRSDCESLLKDKPNGSYLVRDSESSDDKVLSINWNSNVHHYKIKKNESGFYIDSEVGVSRVIFPTYDDLIQYFKVPRDYVPYLKNPVLRNSQSEKMEDNDSDYSDEEDDRNDAEPIKLFFKQQFAVINKSRSDESFYEMLNDYVNKGVNRDFTRFASGSLKPTFLQQLIVKAGTDFQCALSSYLQRLHLIHELFDVGSNIKNDIVEASMKETSEASKDLESILNTMSECKNSILELEQKACTFFEEQSGMLNKACGKTEIEYLELNNNKQPSKKASPSDSYKKGLGLYFEVTSGTLKYKTGIYLDMKACLIKFSKSLNDFNEKDSVTYDMEKVLQLVKSNSCKTKLSIVLENSPIRNVVFENFKARETFCQAVLQMKKSHSNVAKLSVFVGTWNMGDADAPPNITDWFNCFGSGKAQNSELPPLASDIYAIGTQKSAYHQKEWVKRIITDLTNIYNREFKLVKCASLWGICIVIVVKSELINLVSKVKHSSVKTGIANALGNKGAVGVSFYVDQTSFCFVNCHLTSGNEHVLRRNQNYHSILRGLNLGQKDCFDLSLSFHYLFWFGDLNYRIDLDVDTTIKCITTKSWSKLESADQLLAEIKKGNAFVHCSEEDLTFSPTYRYARGNRLVYCWTEVKRTGNRTNIPSWCDRVLWKSYPELDIQNTAYGCTDEIFTSDHSAVFSTFDVDMLSHCQNVQKSYTINTNKQVKMIFLAAEAKILTTSSTKFHLEFHSTCFEKVICSKKNSLLDFKKKQESLFRNECLSVDFKTFAYPWWAKTDIPELIPVIPDADYLQDQFILFAVKGEDSQESYGEGVIALKPLLKNKLHNFECQLTHFGIETGVFKCKLQLNAPQSFNAKVNRTNSNPYAILSVEPDFFHFFPAESESSSNWIYPPSSEDLSKANDNLEALKEWLTKLNCQCYYDTLIENGFDALDFLHQVTEKDLETIKITNPAHRKLIVESARELPSNIST
ncbi:phosphatidylinositol 3,4,5-trisphosphate 5-phosphatase 2A-like isoform X1 [Hydra vulgaris]|uniref:phosphatidylinositol-3,4,5-trisphosphate 5-phosphatase n=1 Tax=Hydra vulgaris TaxID=6087 RepID=A0ABM4B6L5_HYDVU